MTIFDMGEMMLMNMTIWGEEVNSRQQGSGDKWDNNRNDGA
jgi:hypothetical protein